MFVLCAAHLANFNKKVHKPQSKSCTSLTLVFPKMKSDFHTENKIKCLGSEINFVFYTRLPHFTLGLTILADIRKVRQVYVRSDFTEMLD